MLRLPWLVVFVGLTAVAQVRPVAADAGVKADAGVVLPEAPPAPQRSQVDPEVTRLHRELSDLKALIERQSTQLDALSAAVEKVGKQVGQVRTDLSDAEQRRQDEQRVVSERRQQTAQVVASLAWAQQQLATGSTNVAEQLRYAEQTFTGAAQRAVQNARVAVTNGDLQAARTWLAIAVAEASGPHDQGP